MSLSDTKYQIEATVITPLQHFRALVEPLNQTHNDCVEQFSKSMAGLLTGSDGEVAFQGPGSGALANLVGDFLTSEQKLAGSSTDNTFLYGRMLDAAVICEKYVRQLQQALDAMQPSQENSFMVGLATALDVGALGQGGVDIPWDIVAGGATLLAASMANSDVDQASQVKDITIMMWQHDMEHGPNTEPLPKLPPDPQGQNGNESTFFQKVLGLIAIVGTAGAVAYAVYSNWPVDPKRKLSTLTPDELEAIKQYLSQETGCSPTQIQNIIDKILQADPTAQQLQTLLQALKQRTQLQMLLDQIRRADKPEYAEFAKGIRDVIDSIDARINNGTWTANKFPSVVQSWQNSLSGFALQWQAAQELGAKALEVPLANRTPDGEVGQADIIDQNNVWYEAKNYQDIPPGSDVFDKIRDQLANYITDPRYTDMGGHGIGVVVPADRMGKGIDWNLGTELLQALKARYPNDPRITKLKQIYVKPTSDVLPDPSSNRWCRM